jgi:hypothetical protein
MESVELLTPKLQTVLFVMAFVLVYLSVLFWKTVKGSMDLYDFFMLSTVAILPAALVLFPIFTNAISQWIGVAFPFVVMFGGLFSVIFVFLHRTTEKVHHLEKRTRLLVQENALLRQQIEQGLGHE